MTKKKGKKKSKKPQIPKEHKPPNVSAAADTAENIDVKETVGTRAESENQAPPEVRYDDSDSDSDSVERAGGENYDEALQEIMDPWRVLASEGRKEGRKSLSEVIREFDCSDDTGEETRIAFDAVKSTVASLGFRLSRLIIEYFSIFWRYEPKEIAAKTHTAVNTIRHESLEGDDAPSVITNRFVAVIELIERGIKFPRHYNDRDEDDSDSEEYDHMIWVSKRENRILATIFYGVLFLEVLFCFPFFSGATASEKKDSAARIEEFVAEESGFKAKLKSLESEISVLKGEELENEKNLACNEGLEYNGEDLETKRKKAVLGTKIRDIWKGLDKVDI